MEFLTWCAMGDGRKDPKTRSCFFGSGDSFKSFEKFIWGEAGADGDIRGGVGREQRWSEKRQGENASWKYHRTQ